MLKRNLPNLFETSINFKVLKTMIKNLKTKKIILKEENKGKPNT